LCARQVSFLLTRIAFGAEKSVQIDFRSPSDSRAVFTETRIAATGGFTNTFHSFGTGEFGSWQ
jgi:hypothetical protein